MAELVILPLGAEGREDRGQGTGQLRPALYPHERKTRSRLCDHCRWFALVACGSENLPNNTLSSVGVFSENDWRTACTASRHQPALSGNRLLFPEGPNRCPRTNIALPTAVINLGPFSQKSLDALTL